MSDTPWQEFISLTEQLNFTQVWSGTFPYEPFPIENVIIANAIAGILVMASPWYTPYTHVKVLGVARVYLYCWIDQSDWYEKVSIGDRSPSVLGGGVVTGFEVRSKSEFGSTLEKLGSIGQFITPWPEPVFLWLLAEQETCQQKYDYNAATRERLATLPDWVQSFVNMK